MPTQVSGFLVVSMDRAYVLLPVTRDIKGKFEALNTALSQLQQDEPDSAHHATTYASKLELIEGLQSDLAVYQAIVGPTDSSIDTSEFGTPADLFQRLKAKEEELCILRLKEKQRDQVSRSRYQSVNVMLEWYLYRQKQRCMSSWTNCLLLGKLWISKLRVKSST